MLTLEEIFRKAQSYLPHLQEKRILSAYEFVRRAHRESYRFSGDPWIRHLLEVVDILLAFKPDEDTIIAALMHDVMETTLYNAETIRQEFGDTVAALLSALEKLNNLQMRDLHSEEETLRRMFLAMAGDLRVVLIRFADRLHNMKTLEFVQESKRRNIAYETLELYVPIAARLGIYSLKRELEDLCFQYLYPQAFHDLKNQLEQYMKQQEKVIEHIQHELGTFLTSHGIEARIEGRLKNLYSIYKKLKRKNTNSLRELFDIFAIRIILPDRFSSQHQELTDHLYSVLGLIHSRWTPLVHRFKDYVALPKPNGYRSLHIAVLGLTPKPLKEPTEIQIRSLKMHEEADFGLAAHWLYKEMEPKRLDGFLRHEEKKEGEASPEEDTPLYDAMEKDSSCRYWISNIERLQRNLHSQTELLKPLQVNIFQNRIFVLTPTGEVKDLPSGSIPIDFAYAIHTDIGHRCAGAKVNNVIVPLDYKLKNGEIVEIITQKLPDPKPHWLSIVRTVLAKNKIKSYLKGFDTQKVFDHGKEILNKALEHLGYERLDENLLLLKRYGNHKLSMKDRRKIIEDIGGGTLHVGQVIKNVFGLHVSPKSLSTAAAALSPKFQTVSAAGVSNIVPASQSPDRRDPVILIGGEVNVPYKLSLCCKPVIGNPIVAYVGRGKAIRIHHEGCKLLKNVDHIRTLEAKWESLQAVSKRYPVRISLEARDRIGLLRDIADVIAGQNINILDFSALRRVDAMIQRYMVLEVSNKQQLNELLESLQQIRSVVKVEKVQDPESGNVNHHS